MDHDLLATHVDAVYSAAREDFTAERDRRVKELRADGHRDEAEALAAQRKPTVPAWAVDQVARREPDAIADLIAAGDALREAQARAASGAGGGGLRDATGRVRALVAKLRTGAGELITAAGSKPAGHLDEVEQTLFGAAVDPRHHDTLRRGVFDKPLEGSGFDGLEGLFAVGGDAGQASDDAEDAGTRRAARRRELEGRARDLERFLARRREEAEEAEGRVRELRARADEAAAEAEAAREALGSTEEELAGVRSELEELDG